MSTARFCIKHRVTTLLAVIMIAVFGVVFTTQLQMSLLPDMEAPMAVVVCYYNGATPSDMISLVTLIMLAGTAVNNSIVLVDYIKVRREMGESREDAILHACPLRIRPILMTTLTTVLAMVPMALALGDTLEMMSDMGLTMISGMVISTIVTLLFTPVFYSVIDELPKKLRRKGGRKTLEEAAVSE